MPGHDVSTLTTDNPIVDVTLSGTAATIDVTSIPGTYRHLEGYFQGRGDNAGLTVACTMQFNGDTGANYDSIFVYAAATTPNAGQVDAGTSISFIDLAAAGSPANSASSARLSMPFYSGTTFHKQMFVLDLQRSDTAVTTIETIGGNWRSTNAINRIVLAPTSGNFVAGTRLTLYGVN